MPKYIHQLTGWPTFRWDDERLSQRLGVVRHRQGRLYGRMQALGFELRSEAVLSTLAEDVIKSSEIEGEVLDAAQVRSSIARRLGMDIGALAPTDRHVDGVVDMMLDATQHYDTPLTETRLLAWHAALFPTGRSGMRAIVVGAWRDGRAGPMQVVSGPMGRERVHFEAPTAERISAEMSSLLQWLADDVSTDPVVQSAIVHLWFLTIHPFDDGNGRIARAIADMVLARSEQSPQRFYSMSAQIRKERNAYYAILERAQKGDLDITSWLEWYLVCLDRAIDGAEHTLAAVLSKARFWEAIAGQPISARQRTGINRLLDGFEGKLTSSRWAKLTKSSQDSALRDITDLVARGVLVRDGAGGRSTSYSLRTLT